MAADGAGFFGKVASHGDFVSRRLPAGFVAPWDAWLQHGLHASREVLGPDWLALYLTCPFWRFGLPPGVCGDEAWTGVMMPSVDRVGRHFPLTLAARAPGPPLERLATQDGWYARLEALALSALHEGFVLDDFDRELQALAAPARGREEDGEAIAIPLAPDLPLGEQLAAPGASLLARLAGAALGARTVWWSAGSPAVAPALLACRGLPSPRHFVALLDGQWEEHGWDAGGDRLSGLSG